MAIDTLAYVKELEAAGVPRDQAEAQVRALAQHALPDLATKDDLRIALTELKAAAESADLAERFRCHGHCNKPTMREMFARCHVVIVPTTSEFIEGFNQVVAEGVLSGRPVITSSVCPALDYVRDAVVEVPPDDVKGYGDAILKLRKRD